MCVSALRHDNKLVLVLNCVEPRREEKNNSDRKKEEKEKFGEEKKIIDYSEFHLCSNIVVL